MNSNLLIQFQRKGLVYLRDLLRELVSREIKIRYKRSILGIVWTLLNPLAELLVLSFVFQFVLPVKIPDFIPFLYTGLLSWSWFRASLYSGTAVIVQNRSLIKLPNFPVAILPVVSTTSQLVNFLLSLPLLILFILADNIRLTPYILLLPCVIVVQFVFILSLIYFVAAIHVNFRDTQYLLGIVLMLGFYLSPIFYDIGRIPQKFQFIYRLNPMVTIIEAYRTVLIRGNPPDSVLLLLIGVVSIGLLWLTHRFFKRASYNFAEEL